MAKEKMLQAQELLKQKRYDEARAILETVDHPVAQKWLAKLDEIAPAKGSRGKKPAAKGPAAKAPAGESSRGSGLVRILVILIVVLVIAGLGIFVLPRFLPGAATSTSGTGDNGAAAAVGSGNAQIAAVNNLAKYFPANEMVFVGMATDDATLNTVDGLLNSVMTKLPPSALPAGITFSLKTLLNQTSQQYTGADFATGVRAWLGDSAAFGGSVGQKPGSESGFAAVAITNKDKAVEFVMALASKNATKVDRKDDATSGYTILTLTPAQIIIAVGKDVLFIAPSTDMMPLSALPNPALPDDAAFKATLKLLPQPKYDNVVYVNTSQILKLSTANLPANATNPAVTSLLQIDLHNIVAFTVLDGHSLMLDAAQHIGNPSAMTEQAVPFTLGSGTPLDLDFLSYVPANASLVVHGTNLKAIYDLALQNIKAQSPKDAKSIDDSITRFDQQLTTMTGLKLQDDILSWLTGDYAFFVSYTAPAPGTPPIFAASLYPDQKFDLGMEFGFVVKATDPTKAKNLVEGIAKPLTQAGNSGGIKTTRETIAGVNAIVVSISQPNLNAPIDIVIAANDKILVVATRKAATDALNGTGGLASAPAFASAKTYLLPNATLMMYADSNTVNLAGDAILLAVNNVFSNIVSSLNGEPAPRPNVQQQRAQVQAGQQNVRDLAKLFNSATISAAGTESGDSVVRFVISLSP